MKASSLAEHFGVSTETIRKDLIYLESQGIAQKSYGGAIASSELLLERPIAQKEMERMEIKTAIAERAASMIPRNGVIFLDAGSTTYALARLLRLREDLTVLPTQSWSLTSSPTPQPGICAGRTCPGKQQRELWAQWV